MAGRRGWKQNAEMRWESQNAELQRRQLRPSCSLLPPLGLRQAQLDEGGRLGERKGGVWGVGAGLRSMGLGGKTQAVLSYTLACAASHCAGVSLARQPHPAHPHIPPRTMSRIVSLTGVSARPSSR